MYKEDYLTSYGGIVEDKTDDKPKNYTGVIILSFIVVCIILFLRWVNTSEPTTVAIPVMLDTPVQEQIIIAPPPPTEFAIRHASGKCLHPLGGLANPNNSTPVIFHEGCDEDRVKFTLTPGGSLKHKTSGKCLHPISGSANPTDNTSLVFYEGCDEDRLRFEFSNDGSLRHSSGKCIHPRGGSATPGNNTPAVFYNECGQDRIRFSRV